MSKHLTLLLRAIRRQAPNARIVTIGYVDTFAGQLVHGSCGFIRDTDINRLLSPKMGEFNSTIERTVAAAGEEYVDINALAELNGHRECDNDGKTSWVHNFDGGSLAKHPYQLGALPKLPVHDPDP